MSEKEEPKDSPLDDAEELYETARDELQDEIDSANNQD